MFLAFDPYLLLAMICCFFFIPGVIISVALLKGVRLGIFEKSIIGLGLGFSVPQLVPFLLFLLFDIKYTYGLAIATVAVWWLLALTLAGWKRIDKDVVDLAKNIMVVSQGRALLCFAMAFLVLLAFWIRLGSYSPVFYELDPYYYIYISQQIITLGFNPLADQTAWWPHDISHRAAPVLAYMESLWYSLYNGSNDYSNMLLAAITSVYPPVAAALAVLLFYLFLSQIVRQEYAVLGAGIASFTPMFLLKTMAGEMEIQPYAFFALAFFYSTYLLMLKEKSRVLALVSGLAFIALALGSASAILALVVLALFWLAYVLVLFYKNESADGLKSLLELNALFVSVGIIGSAFLGFLFNGGLALSSLLLGLIILALPAGLYIIQIKKIAFKDRNVAVAIAAFLILIFMLSPLAGPIKSMGRSGFAVVEYKTALDRTIAEQGMAGHDFSNEIGFVGANYESIISFFFPDDNSRNFFGLIVSPLLIVLGIISSLSNMLLAVLVSAINFILSSNVTYDWKANSFVMLWPAAMTAAAAYHLYEKRKETPEELLVPLLFMAVVFPPFIVGILKAKYTIYAAFFIAGGVAYVFSVAERFLKNRKILKESSTGLVLVMVAILILQFFYANLAFGLTIGNFEIRFQDDPYAAKEKLDAACQQTGDSTICTAAANPMAYAKLGTNYQYNQLLCMITALPGFDYYTDPQKAPHLYKAAALRCHKLSDYWISSMEWIRDSTEKDARITSWWDYGHWINFFGQRNSVLRNEHAYLDMIYRVAYSYTEGNEEDLLKTMQDYGSEYALFDVEILGSSEGFGAKFGALNYLGCVHANRTNVSYWPGQSDCEREKLFEVIYVSQDKICTISENPRKTGFVASRVYIGPPNGEQKYSVYYPGECVGSITNEQARYFCANYVHLVPVYCVGEVELATGDKMTGTYYLNETYPNGDLRVNKAFLVYPSRLDGAYNQGPLMAFTTVYTKQKVWLENGQIVDGYDDRKTHFYESNIYKALVLDELEGFDKVYDNGAVKIYKIRRENVLE